MEDLPEMCSRRRSRKSELAACHDDNDDDMYTKNTHTNIYVHTHAHTHTHTIYIYIYMNIFNNFLLLSKIVKI